MRELDDGIGEVVLLALVVISAFAAMPWLCDNVFSHLAQWLLLVFG